jgi:hypothetical protein
VSSWASDVGAAQDVYIGSRLGYRGAHEEGDEAFSAYESKYIVSLIVRTWLLATVAWLIVGFIPVLFVDAVFSEKEAIGLGQTETSHPTGLMFLTAMATWVALFLLAGLLRERQWASQWEMILDGRHEAAPMAYHCITSAIQTRHLPFTIDDRPQGPDGQRYLAARFGVYHAYVGVFPYGTSLFMTWSMWREDRALFLVCRHIIESISGNDPLRQVMRTDPARAMRDALHNAVREGVDYAASQSGSGDGGWGAPPPPIDLTTPPPAPAAPAPSAPSAPSAAPFPGAAAPPMTTYAAPPPDPTTRRG